MATNGFDTESDEDDETFNEDYSNDVEYEDTEIAPAYTRKPILEVNIGALPYKNFPQKMVRFSHTMASKIEPLQKGSPKELELYLDNLFSQYFTNVKDLPLQVGTVVDCMLTQQEHKLKIVADDMILTGKVLDICKLILKNYPTVQTEGFDAAYENCAEEISYYANQPMTSKFHTTAKKAIYEYITFLRENSKNEVVSLEAYNLGTTMATKLQNNLSTRQLLLGGLNQLKLEWNEIIDLPPIDLWPTMNIGGLSYFINSLNSLIDHYGCERYIVPCKTKLDSLIVKPNLKTIVELKTISNGANNITKTVADFGKKEVFVNMYTREIAIQYQGLDSCNFGVLPDGTDVDLPFSPIEAKFIVCEGSRHFEYSVYKVDASVINFGRTQFLAAMIRYVFHRIKGFDLSLEEYFGGGSRSIMDIPRYMLNF